MTTIGLQVPAYPVGVAGSLPGTNDYIAYAYATHRVNGCALVGPHAYYCKGRDDKYRRVYSRASTTGWATAQTPGLAGTPATNSTAEIGVCPVITTGTYYIVIGGRWLFKGQYPRTPTPAGNINFALYAPEIGAGATDFGSEPVAVATVPKSDFYTQLATSGNFWIDFSFNAPFVFGEAPTDGSAPAESGLLLTMALDTTGTMTPNLDDFTSGSVNATGTDYVRTNGVSRWLATSGVYAPAAELYCVQFVDDRIETPEHYYAYIFKCKQYDPGASQTPCDISDLEFIVNAPGVTDSAGGAITGVGGATIERPDHVIHYLTQEYGVSSFVDSVRYTFTPYDALYTTIFGNTAHKYYRKVSGVLDGELTVEQAIAQVVDETACMIVPSSTAGKLTLLPWGEPLTVSKVFSDENADIRGWSRLGIESVVNTAAVAYGKGCLNYQESAQVNRQGFENYYGIIRSEELIGIALTTGSITAYGIRENKIRALNWIGDAQSATAYLKHRLTVFDHPHWTVTLEVPYKDNYALLVGNVVEILSCRLPAYFGTSPAARDPYYSGAEVDITLGQYMTRAQRYRCMIVGSEINWDANIAPTLVLTCRVLAPYHPNDPT